MLKARLPCPVCIGTKMEKRAPAGSPTLVLDLCMRCGGIWFEHGEIQATREAAALPDPGDRPLASPVCPSCHAVVARSEPMCPACGELLQVDCPVCDVPMKSVRHGGLTLDLCTTCRGVWFDRGELTHIWSMAAAAVQRRLAQSGSSHATGPIDKIDAVASLVDSLAYAPDLGVVVVEGAARGAAASVDIAVTVVPEPAGAVAEIAGAVFEILIEAVGAILSGLSV